MKRAFIVFISTLLVAAAQKHPPPPPAPVTAFYASRKAELELLTDDQLSSAGWRLDIGQPSYQRISSYKGAPAWLVHFPAFYMSRVQHSGIAILNDDGAEIAELMKWDRSGEPPVNCEFYASSSASVIQIGANLHMIAEESEPYHHSGGSIGLYFLEPEPALVLSDHGGSWGSSAKKPCDSMYYFMDVTGDGIKDILINRRVFERPTEDGGAIKNQKLIYKVNGPDKAVEEVTNQYFAQLVTFFQAAKADAAVEKVAVYGPARPAENGVLIAGEAIFPNEADYCSTPYLEVRAPDLGPVPDLMPETKFEER